MSRLVLRPACLRRGDARALANALITRLEGEGDMSSLDAWIAVAETGSAWLTPTITAPSLVQKLWRLRFFTQTLELSTLNLIEQVVSATGCPFIDVGAHVGYFSITATAAGARSVTAIEMHPANWRLLQANVPSAVTMNAAAGQVAGEREYFLGAGHSNHSLIQRGDTSDVRASIPVVTLDDVLTIDARQSHLIKIDVQGYETSVLRGYQNGLTAEGPILVFEVERNDDGPGLDAIYEDALALLIGYEYRLFWIGEDQLVEIHGTADTFLRSIPKSSNILAVASSRFAAFDAALHQRRV